MSASRTAQYVALYRALEHLERRRPRLFDDPFATAFLPRAYRLLLAAARVPSLHARLSRYADRRAPGARSSAIARTRFIDDVARRCAADGVDQVVLLGAGFDSRAHRLPELSGATVFEVDRPGTQSVKRALLGDAPGAARVRYVAVDFLRDDPAAALARAGWNGRRTTLFVWEGVTNYLTETAVAAVLGWIGGTAAGSTLVMTYIHAGLLEGTQHFEGGSRILENVRALGEPWTFGLHPDAVAPFLSRFGLRLVEDLGADDYRRRYGLDDDGDRRGYAFYRLAVATARGPGDRNARPGPPGGSEPVSVGGVTSGGPDRADPGEPRGGGLSPGGGTRMSSGGTREARDRLLSEAIHARNRGRIRRAIALYRRVLHDDPASEEAAVRLAPLLASRGEHFEAWMLFRGVARVLLAERRFEECLALAREACRWVPSEFDAWRLRVDLELKLDRERTAFETLLEARNMYATVGTRAQAIALLTRARTIEPWDPEVCIDLARLYARTDQFQAARELLAGLERRAEGGDLRRARGLQWRLTLSFHHAWRWLLASMPGGARRDALDAGPGCLPAGEAPPHLR